ncbi:hypothetical protein RFI_14018 [Reticulomyxa filosa]|uniref:Uncharacterized protein n=1 Tax=Reticulomyxa filosa TaxID=46433 RepID=X6NCW5_RETFI|nr:hypothetical protein RFI_14018 [Reticulomyxa filosa]|eukprot:ETO23167.1 hypothetical protein RFI_14018 [Reticulomyxa filosa]
MSELNTKQIPTEQENEEKWTAVDPTTFLGKTVTLETGHSGTVVRYDSTQKQYRVEVWKKHKLEQSKKPPPIFLDLERVNEAKERWHKSQAEENQDLDTMAVEEFNATTDSNEETKIADEAKHANKNKIKKCELLWIFAQRNMAFDLKQLEIDLGTKEAEELMQAYARYSSEWKEKKKDWENDGKDIFKSVLDALMWPGICTRWKCFFEFVTKWIIGQDTIPTSLQSLHDLVEAFANELGRVTSYRALGLKETEVQAIYDLNRIVPTGGLKATPAELKKIINTEGLTKCE